MTAPAEQAVSRPWLVALGVLLGVSIVVLLATLASSSDGASHGDALPAPRLVEVSSSAGVGQRYEGESDFFVGGGVAVFDCDDDRRPELYLAGGAGPAGLYLNESETGGELSFASKPSPVTDLIDVTGAYPLDVDSDGITDLVVLRRGENVVLRGVGDCEFEPANQRWGIEGGAEWTAAFSAMWEPRAVLPTLVFGNYLAIEDNDDRNRCDDHQLFRPEGDSYSEPETLSPGWCTLSVLFSDWDDSGSPDLRVTNDRHYYRDGQEQMWDFQPGEEPRLYTQEDGWALMQIWGMGIASQDLDEDGLPEVFLTSQGDNKLQTLTAGSGWPSYEDEALAVGVTAHRPFAGDTDLPSTAWHAEFDDVNNDGYLDLLITKGNVDSQEGFAMEDPNNLLLGQPDGGFVEGAEAAGFLDFELSRGGALADLNLDGLLDVVVVERREPVRLWRNEGVAGSDEHWLAVDIEQSGPNTDAIGATVEVKVGPTTISNELTVGGGHASGEIGWSHFGLGPSESAELRIVWPDGAADSWTELDADRFYLVERGSEPRLWDPGTG